MKRLEKLREYRSRLANDVDARIAKFICDGKPAEQVIPLSDFVRNANFRMRRTNAEIDRLIAADPRVLRPATA
ncbi:MAG TPA: hypothetical protein VN025_05945 [Candidatus Dormibacteraeota bacterium]|nr:hypothetical protein [Candidatus Dormibacteraeota bacterium]